MRYRRLIPVLVAAVTALTWSAAPAAVPAVAATDFPHAHRTAAAFSRARRAADPRAQRAAPSSAGAANAVALAGAALVQQQQLAQAAQAWQQQLANLAAEARRQGDSGMLVVVQQVDGVLQSIAAFPATAAGFLAALQASQSALAIWARQQPGAPILGLPEWQAADQGAAGLGAATEASFVFAADLTHGTAWSGTPEPDDPLPAPAAPAPPAPPTLNTAPDPAGADIAAGVPEDDEDDDAMMPSATDPAALDVGGYASSEVAAPLQAGAAADPAQAALDTLRAQGIAASTESPASGWIVVHGGPAQPAAVDEIAEADDAAFVLQLGALDGAAPLGDTAGEAGHAEVGGAALGGLEPSTSDGAGDLAAALLDDLGDPVCRPWQLPPSSCPLRPAHRAPF